MARQQDVDVLFEVKNSFYIGNYQQCINETQKIKNLPEELHLERDAFLYRSYIAQKKYRIVLDEITSAVDPQLLPLKTLAEYLSNKTRREGILNAIDRAVSNESKEVLNPNFSIAASTIYCLERNPESALKVLHYCETLEGSALKLQAYLRMDRVDLAKKELKVMQEKDEDSTLTQLAQAWLNIAMGGEKLQDAYYIFQELMDKYGASSVLLNGQAVTFIGQGKLEEAEAALQQAMDKDSNNPDTLLNMMVLSQHLSKPVEVANRYRTQLADSNDDHPFVTDFRSKEAEFDRLQRVYTIQT